MYRFMLSFPLPIPSDTYRVHVFKHTLPSSSVLVGLTYVLNQTPHHLGERAILVFLCCCWRLQIISGYDPVLETRKKSKEGVFANCEVKRTPIVPSTYICTTGMISDICHRLQDKHPHAGHHHFFHSQHLLLLSLKLKRKVN